MDKDMSFLPEDYLAQKVARRTNFICLTLFVLVMGGVVAAFFVTDKQRHNVKEEQAQINVQFEEAARRLDQLTMLQDRKKEVLQKARITGALVERVPRSIMLSEMINHMPTSMGLLELELQTSVLSQSRISRTIIERRQADRDAKADEDAGQIKRPETEVKLDLVGVANSDVEVAQFMTAMRAHPVFNDVNLVYSELTEYEQRKLRKFRVQMVLNQDIDINGIEPARIARGLEQDPMDGEIRIEANKEEQEQDAVHQSVSHPTQ